MPSSFSSVPQPEMDPVELLWRYWKKAMTDKFGPGKIGCCTSLDRDDLYLLLELCDGNKDLAGLMLGHVVKYWAEVKNDCWEVKRIDFPTLSVVKQIRNYLYAKAYEHLNAK